jgi:tripartite-type tricarboxylate transporter receptor subunit TctC
MTDINLVTVNYRGVGPALPDLISGRVDVMFDPVASTVGYIRSGKLRPLGVTTTRPIDVLPGVPAIDEFVRGYEATAWTGIGAPAKVPVSIIDSLNKEINAALADSAFKGRLAELGMEPFANSPAEFGRFIANETQKWGKVIRAANIKAE